VSRASPIDFHQSHAGLAVTVFAKSNRHKINFPGRWNNHSAPTKAECDNDPQPL
jgi:hypothetical protein